MSASGTQGAPKSLRAFNEEIVQLNQNPRRRSAADHAGARMARLAAEYPMCALLSLASFALGLVAHSVIFYNLPFGILNFF